MPAPARRRVSSRGTVCRECRESNDMWDKFWSDVALAPCYTPTDVIPCYCTCAPCMNAVCDKGRALRYPDYIHRPHSPCRRSD